MNISNKVFIATVNDCEIAVKNARITGRELLHEAGITNVKCHTLYQKLVNCDFEKISMDEIVDLSNQGVERFITKDAETFDYTVNGEPETSDKKQLTPREILLRAGIDAEKNYLIQLLVDGSTKEYYSNPSEPITMVCSGMNFISKLIFDIVDVEEYGKQCKEVPIARQYKIRIDKNYHLINSGFITGEEIILLEGKAHGRYDVYKFLNNSPKPQKLNQNDKVNLRERCLIRFVLQPKEQQEGKSRLSFTLPSEDIETLNSLGLLWETLNSGGTWLIIYNYPIPKGYNEDKVDLALMIPPYYPTCEIDMAYFYPPLHKLSGKAIGCISSQLIDEKQYQRWSRHRLAGEWSVGVDSLATHLCLVDNWLQKDLEK